MLLSSRCVLFLALFPRARLSVLAVASLTVLCSIWTSDCQVYRLVRVRTCVCACVQGFHTICWVANIFGMFFVLAAHEHYTIDVLIAFYISSRLFLYYHTLAHLSALKKDGRDRVLSW